MLYTTFTFVFICQVLLDSQYARRCVVPIGWKFSKKMKVKLKSNWGQNCIIKYGETPYRRQKYNCTSTIRGRVCVGESDAFSFLGFVIIFSKFPLNKVVKKIGLFTFKAGRRAWQQISLLATTSLNSQLWQLYIKSEKIKLNYVETLSEAISTVVFSK